MSITCIAPNDLWNEPSVELQLGEGEIHVWRLDLSRVRQQVGGLLSCLSKDERERASRFHFQKDREHFIAARGVLRVLLGRYLNLTPEELRFQYSSYGKPSLDVGPDGERLSFNLSHSHERALLAFTRAGEIGVDLEFMRADFACHEVAERWFSNREVEIFSALPGSLRTEAFFNCWTRKEAYVKARGEGLSHPLKSFSVSLAPDEAARFLSIEGDRLQCSRWSLQNLHVAEGYAAALAVENTCCETLLWETEPDALAAWLEQESLCV